ncbi:MAG: hypothetical protein NZ699_16385 [Roseiflexus sp.]|nr:hypothetical protein [Roseiflexus sp.]MDW8145414.1 hypothetical protein [Roseiflexaceae bacterium]MDW8232247.1 hypothetical protein [Roseiflexaceae bacterium]
MPTSTPERTTIPVGPAPLTVTKTASTNTVLPGQSFTYTLHVTTARDQAQAEVRDILDPGVEVVDIKSSSGACTGAGIVVCRVQMRAQEPATILIIVRVRATLAPDTWLISQALAQDDLDFTAASERVAVRVVAPPPVMSAPVATASTSAEASPAETIPNDDHQDASESRAASCTGAALSPAPLPIAIFLTPTAAPSLARAAEALAGATEPASSSQPAILNAAALPATTSGSEQPASWLDMVTTVGP